MPADRFNVGKPELSHILHFPTSMVALARILEYGAHKYAPLNWKKGGINYVNKFCFTMVSKSFVLLNL